MSAPFTYTEIQSIEHLDQEFPCDTVFGDMNHPCPRPATWIVTKNCCPAHDLQCDECMKDFGVDEDGFAWEILCTDCNTTTDSDRYMRNSMRIK